MRAFWLLMVVVVAGQQGVDVVSTADTSTVHGGQVPREGVVGQARANVRVTIFVDVWDFVVRGDGLGHVCTGHAFFGFPTEFSQRRETHEAEGVTGLTTDLVDVQAALELALVVMTERAGESPGLGINRAGGFSHRWGSSRNRKCGGRAE